MSDDGLSPNGLYINRTTGSLMRLESVDDSFAYLSILAPKPSAYAMPIADYDGGAFVRAWKPATTEDLTALAPDTSGIRAPRTPMSMAREIEAAGETPETT